MQGIACDDVTRVRGRKIVGAHACCPPARWRVLFGGAAMFVNIRLLRVDGDAIDLKPPAPERVRRTVSTVLNSTELCAWATVSPKGDAHINTGFFAHSDELLLYLLSHPESLHCRNLAVNASMAAAIYVSA
jgi:hypothetical protein